VQLKDVATIRFQDNASRGEGVAVIRAGKGLLALCLSLADDGDVEVVLHAKDSRKLLAALQRASEIAEGTLSQDSSP
jgi:hypothetical protein